MSITGVRKSHSNSVLSTSSANKRTKKSCGEWPNTKQLCLILTEPKLSDDGREEQRQTK